MAGSARFRRVLRIIAVALSSAAAIDAWAQQPSAPPARSDVFSTQGSRGGPSQGDAFNTQGQRGGPCDTNIWIRAHGGHWDRCQYELDCPGLDTRMYGAPDRFSATEGERMRGYARCAVDPCTPGGAQCWGRPGSDNINTRGTPNQQTTETLPTDDPNKAAGRKSIKRVYEPRLIGRGADARTMVEAIDRCVREKGRLPYYVSPRTAQSGGLATYLPKSGTVTYNPKQLDKQKPYIRAYYIAGAYGAYIVSLKEQYFGRTGSPRERQLERDYLIGNLARCLVSLKLLEAMRDDDPDDPRLQFWDFMYREGGGVPLTTAADERVHDFSRGWWESRMPLLPDIRRD